MVNLYSYTAILPIRILTSVLPRSVALFLAEICGSCAFYLMRKSRKQIESNIVQVGVPLKNTIIRRTFCNYAKYLADFMYLPRINKNNIYRYFLQHPDRYALQKIIDKTKGTIVVTGHLGHWELGGALLSINGYKITTVAIRESGTKAFVDFRETARSGLGVRTIYVEDNNSSLESLAAIKRGELVAMLIDRSYDANGIPVTFLGKPFLFPRGPLILSALTGSAILPASIVLSRFDKYAVTLHEPLYVNPVTTALPRKRPKVLQGFSGNGVKNSDDEMLKMTAEKLIHTLEEEIRKHIEQWYNFQIR